MSETLDALVLAARFDQLAAELGRRELIEDGEMTARW